MKKIQLLGLALISTMALNSCGEGGVNSDPEPIETTDSTGKPAFVYGEKEGPQMAFEKIEHNFGEITQGDIVKYPFLFTNTGTDTLIIYRAKTTCGCTTSKISENTPILPGATDTIEVQFNSTRKAPGNHMKEVKIETNVFKSREEPVTIKILATVLKNETPLNSDTIKVSTPETQEKL